jgi:hypothetical protein
MPSTKYAADFETTTDPADCRVWAWSLAMLDNPEIVETDNSLDRFLARCARKNENMLVFFHNLKFDGEFILYWLFANGFRHVTDKKHLESLTFTTLITVDGKFYEIIVCFYKKGHHTNKVTFRDSLKLLPFTVDEIARSFNLPYQKQDLDYRQKRERGHLLTEHERAYIENDVKIVAAALNAMYNQGLTRMTLGSNALADFKKTMPFYSFDRHFPVPVYDEEIRQAYFGGYAMIRKDLKNAEIWDGIVLDVNSLYPYVMKEKPLPFGEGIYFSGEYKKNVVFPLYFQMLNCQFRIRPGFLPTIPQKAFPGQQEHYLESSGDEVVCLYLTSLDLDLFFRHYDVFNIEYIGGWMFKGKRGLYDGYIDKWAEIKRQAKMDNNKPLYQIAKLMLNSLYGKLATSPRVQSKIPVFIDGIVDYENGSQEYRDPVYIPAAAFITAWARNVTITAAQQHYDRFVYCDTDSLHLAGLDMPKDLDIDPSRIGAWKHEMTFRLARFIRPKCYLEYGRAPDEDRDDWHVTVAGLPINCHCQVTWNNFVPGVKYSGRLQPRRVPGGVVLEDVDFTIELI